MVALCTAGAWPWGLSVGRSNGNRVGYVKCNVLTHNFLTHAIVAEDVIYWQHNLAEFGVFDMCHMKQWRELLEACEILMSRAANVQDGDNLSDYDRLFWYCVCVLGNFACSRHCFRKEEVAKRVVMYAKGEQSSSYAHDSVGWKSHRAFEFHYFSRHCQMWLRNELMSPPPPNLEHELSMSDCEWLVEMGKPWSIATNANNVWHGSTRTVGRLVLLLLMRHFPNGIVPQVVEMICGHYAHVMRRYPSVQQISHFTFSGSNSN